MGPDYQSHLCCSPDNTSPRLAFTSTSTAADFDFHSEVTSPLKNVLASSLLTSLRSHFTSQERACKCTFYFHSEVTSLLKNVLASALLTITQMLLHLSRTCLQVHFWLSLKSHFAAIFILFGKACHCGTGFFCGAVVLLLWAWHCNHVPAQDAHCELGFAHGTVSAQILRQGAIRPTGQGRTLLFPFLFVPAQLSPSLLPGATLLK